jgi:hypothetical protein
MIERIKDTVDNYFFLTVYHGTVPHRRSPKWASWSNALMPNSIDGVLRAAKGEPRGDSLIERLSGKLVFFQAAIQL